jgi:hypothetical protein
MTLDEALGRCAECHRMVMLRRYCTVCAECARRTPSFRAGRIVDPGPRARLLSADEADAIEELLWERARRRRLTRDAEAGSLDVEALQHSAHVVALLVREPEHPDAVGATGDERERATQWTAALGVEAEDRLTNSEGTRP